MHSGYAEHTSFARLDLQRKCAQDKCAFSFAFFSINDTMNHCPLFLSDANAVAAGAAGSTVISVVVLKETTDSVATVSGLCPLLHQQEFPSRHHGRAIGLDDAVPEMYDTAHQTDAR